MCTCMPAHTMQHAVHALLACFAGPAKVAGYRAKILFSPNATTELMQNFARAVACPADPAKKADISTAFPALFRAPNPDPACEPADACMSNPACIQHVWANNLQGFASPQEAEQFAAGNPDTVDAVIELNNLSQSAGQAHAMAANTTGVQAAVSSWMSTWSDQALSNHCCCKRMCGTLTNDWPC